MNSNYQILIEIHRKRGGRPLVVLAMRKRPWWIFYWITRHMGDFLNWLSSMQQWIVALNRNPQLELESSMDIFHTCLYVCACMWTYASVCVCHIPIHVYIYIIIWSSMHTHLWSMCRILQPKPSLLTRSWTSENLHVKRNAKHQGMAAKRPRNAALTDRFSRRGR